MRTGNRILFGSFVVVLLLLIAVPVLLSASGSAGPQGVVAAVIGLVLFVLFWGTILKLVRRVWASRKQR